MDVLNPAPEAGTAAPESAPPEPVADPAAAVEPPVIDPPAPPDVTASATQPDPNAPPVPPAPPADPPKRAPKQRKQAPTKPPGWYATESFRTQYNGQMLSFTVDQLIDDETMATWLADTGSPVDYLEG